MISKNCKSARLKIKIFSFRNLNLTHAKKYLTLQKVKKNVSSLAHKQHPFLSGLAGSELWAPGM